MLTLVFVAIIVVAVAMILAVLMQSGHASGMSASIGGVSQQMYGKKQGLDELLERVTMILGALLVILTTLGARMWR